MPKKKTVIFSPDGRGARLLINAEHDPEGSLVNPPLRDVRGISPDFWKLEDGKIVAMTDFERASVSQAKGCFEAFELPKIIKQEKLRTNRLMYAWLVVNTVLAVIGVVWNM